MGPDHSVGVIVDLKCLASRWDQGRKQRLYKQKYWISVSATERALLSHKVVRQQRTDNLWNSFVVSFYNWYFVNVEILPYWTYLWNKPIVREIMLNSLWHSGAIWKYRSGSTLAHVMAWWLAPLSHYLSQRWLIISKVQCRGGGSQELPQP